MYYTRKYIILEYTLTKEVVIVKYSINIINIVTITKYSKYSKYSINILTLKVSLLIHPVYHLISLLLLFQILFFYVYNDSHL